MKTVKQFSKFSSVAGGAALTDYFVFWVLLYLELDVVLAQMIARLFGGILSFTMNKNWSFNTNSNTSAIKEGRRFLILYAISYVLAIAVLYLLITQASFNAYPAKITADIVCFLVNFVVMRQYVFSDRGGLRTGLKMLIFRLVKST
jgi:putative flippase GtrA